MPAGMILALWLCQIGDSSCRLVHSSTTSLRQIRQRCCYFDERDDLVIDHPRLSTYRLSRRALVELVAFAVHVMRLTRVVYRASCIVKLAWASCVKASCVQHRVSSIRLLLCASASYFLFVFVTKALVAQAVVSVTMRILQHTCTY